MNEYVQVHAAARDGHVYVKSDDLSEIAICIQNAALRRLSRRPPAGVELGHGRDAKTLSDHQMASERTSDRFERLNWHNACVGGRILADGSHLACRSNRRLCRIRRFLHLGGQDMAENSAQGAASQGSRHDYRRQV
jgi:hypothetical protein